MLKKLLYKKNSVRALLWMIIVIAGMVPLMIINIVTYRQTNRVLYEKEIQLSSDLLDELNLRLENVFNAVTINSYSFILRSEIKEMLNRNPRSEEERKAVESEIKDLFREMKTNNSMICSVTYLGKNYQISSETRQVDFYRLEDLEWYKHYDKFYVYDISPVYHNDYVQGYNTKVVSIYRKINHQTSNSIGNLVIEISYANIKSVMEKTISISGNRGLIVDKHGNVIYSSFDIENSDENEVWKVNEEREVSADQVIDKVGTRDGVDGKQAATGKVTGQEVDHRENLVNKLTKLGENSEIEIDGVRYTCLSRKNASTGWDIYWFVNKDMLLSDIRISAMQTLWIATVILVISFLLAHVLAAKITKPIYQLNTQMKEMDAGNLDSFINLQSSLSEFQMLSHGYNTMLMRIRELIENIKSEEQEKNELEINMLQQQINPHFLYNTLNVIRWTAVMHGENTISSMILSLIKLLEFSGKRTKTFIPIEKELDHAKSYLSIVMNQYVDDFEVVYDVDPEVLSCYTVKFVLQPLVENALFHGIEPSGKKGQITIRIHRQGDMIAFAVEDNGVGMDKVFKDNDFSAFRGLGLENVYKRLLMHYGDQIHWHIVTAVGCGMCVQFQIPIRYELEGDE